MFRVCFFRRKAAEENNGLGQIAQTPEFSEPEQLTQHKSKRLIEGFVCNPLLFWLDHATENRCW
jgi:hypothetical protein